MSAPYYIEKRGDSNFGFAVIRDGEEKPIASGLSASQAEAILKKYLAKEEHNGLTEQAW